MRDIRFRAWDKECQVMRTFDEFMNVSVASLFENDNFELMQYIGLKDRNRVEVYEGDIVQTYFSFSPGDAGYGVSQKPFVVKWEQGRSGFRAYKPNYTNDWHLLDVVDFFEVQSNIYEVIGNIHDNPELLKGVKSDG